MRQATADEMIAALVGLDHPTKLAATEFARQNLDDPSLESRDRDCIFWHEGWNRSIDHGVGGVLVAPEFGGRGGSLFDALLLFEGLGVGCRDAGLLFALAGHVWTVQPMIERFGSPEQRQRWLPRMCAGDAVGAFSISEPDSGSDSFAMTTVAVEQPDGSFVLDGHKSWVTMAPEADFFVVFASTAPDRGRWGVTALLVEATADGLTVGPNRPKMGMRTVPFADLTFEGCRVPADAVLGRVGAGASIFSTTMLSERAYMLAGQVGAMERQLDAAVSWARSRRQFDRPIIDFQAVAHRLADMRLRHENARLQMYRTAILESQGHDVVQAASLAKLQVSEAAIASSIDAMVTWGARGYVTEFGVEADLRNVAGGTVLGGTSDIQRNIIASTLEAPDG